MKIIFEIWEMILAFDSSNILTMSLVIFRIYFNSSSGMMTTVWRLFLFQVSLTLGCPMDLQLFPLDSQTCHISVASYGWTADDLVYLWRVSSKPGLKILDK